MNKKTIILASKSPRRREILKNAGYDFVIIEPEVNEDRNKKLAIKKSIEEIALKKAEQVKGRAENKNSIIIAADTVVIQKDAILGKPRSEQDAFDMLKILSGTEHEVITGFAVVTDNEVITGSESTIVTFRKMEDFEIRGYIKTGEPFDKAGGYGIQGFGSKFVQGIVGDYFNVMGLPICKISLIIDKYIRTKSVDC